MNFYPLKNPVGLMMHWRKTCCGGVCGGRHDVAVPLRLANYSPVITCFRCCLGTPGSERATAAGGSAPPGAGGCGPRSQHVARRLVLRAFRATAPAELQELLRDDGVAAPHDPVMQELAPLVAAVQTLPPVTRKLQQLWQATLQLVQGGSGPRQPAVQAGDAGAMTDARTPSA